MATVTNVLKMHPCIFWTPSTSEMSEVVLAYYPANIFDDSNILLQLSIRHRRAIILMKPLVLFHAGLVAVLDNFALADGFKDVSVVAPFTLADCHFFTFFEIEYEVLIIVFSVFNHNALTFVQIDLVHP